jgi:Flp pilus assembly pilin Flp
MNLFEKFNQKVSLTAWNFVSKKMFGRTKGQTLSEYAIIIGVIVGGLVVGVVIRFRTEIVAAFNSATSALSSAR